MTTGNGTTVAGQKAIQLELNEVEEEQPVFSCRALIVLMWPALITITLISLHHIMSTLWLLLGQHRAGTTICFGCYD